MKTGLTVWAVFFLSAGFLGAEDAEVPTITVTASSRTAQNAAIHDALRAEPGVLLNSQGGSQNDLSIRGSTFSEAGLSLGGLTLRNPQTEHFNAELPLPAALLSRPSVFTGFANQGGHLAGTAGFDLLPVTGRRQFEAGFGTDHRDWQSALVQHLLTDRIGLGLFAGRESARGVDYPDNDLRREFAGAHLQYSEYETRADLIVTHQKKEFGARGYYGVPDTLPATERTEDTLVYLTARKGDLQNDFLRGGISWREFNDDYRLPTLAYRNQHRSRISTAFFEGRTLEVNRWALGWRADADEERIASTGTGGLGHHHRTRGGISLLPRWRNDRLLITAGLRSEFFTGESPHYLPQTGAEFLLSDHLTAFASYTETVRLPSYTELNYNSPASLGNTGLEPQTAQQMEFGFKGIPSEFMDWKIALFHRRTKNTIDWMKAAPAAPWQAANIGTLNTSGAEAELGWYPAQNLELQFAYTWIHKNRRAGDFGQHASRYALDYPDHLAQVSLLWRPVQALEVGAVQSARRQTANTVRRGSDFGADSSLVARFTPPQADYATLSLLLSNVWDDDFEVFPGQRPPKRYIGLSLTLTW